MKIRIIAFALFALSAGTAVAAVNLTPYQPTGWSDRLVISKVAGTNTNGSGFTTSDSLFIDWGVLNDGSTATTTTFYTSLVLDGTTIASWYSNPPLGSYYYTYIIDYELGRLSAGTHTLTLVADSTNSIAETNESDNRYTRTFTVAPAGVPNLTPYQPAGWSDRIVASKVTGTNTNATSLTTADPLYIDWAVTNAGSGSTSSIFYTELLVDGVVVQSWYSDPPVGAGTYVYVSDYALGTLTAGTHTLTLRTDSTGAIGESNEADNSYSRSVSIVSAGTPNLTPYQPTGWSDEIVVSTGTGTNTDSASLPSTSTLYVDWAVLNNGNAATAARFYTELRLNGQAIGSWYSDPPINQATYVYVADHPIGPLAAGTHTLTLVVDSTGAVAEGNEADNQYTKTFTVSGGGSSLYQGPASGTSGAGALRSTTTFPALPESTVFADPVPIPEPDGPIPLLPDPLPPAASVLEDRSNEVDDLAEADRYNVRVMAAVTGTTFTAFNDTGSIPPDPALAVGPSHIVAGVNTSFALFTKTGTRQRLISSQSWFNDVLPGLGSTLRSFDPRVVYDHTANRWIVAYIAISNDRTQSWILLAVSDDSDPNGNWCNFALRGDRNGSTAVSNWADYDMLGYDSQAVYVSTNQFSYSNDTFTYAKIRVLLKSQLYNAQCGALTWTDLWDLRQPSDNSVRATTVHPVTTFGSAPGQYFVSDSPYVTGSFMTLWTLRNPTTTPVLEAVEVPVATRFHPPDANQLGGSRGTPSCPAPCLISTNDTRILSAFYRDGSVWAAHTVAGGANNAYSRARYVRVATNPVAKLEDQSFGLDNCWYFYPAVATDAASNLVMTFGRSCISEYAGGGYTTRAAGDSALQPSVMVRHGGANYVKTYAGNRNRWGDYFGAAIDPADSARIWIHAQQASQTTDMWATFIASVSFGAGGGCAMSVNPSSLGAGTAGRAYPAVTFTAPGGTGAIAFARSGALPSGMTLSGATLSGTPTQTGTFPFTISATDGAGCTASRNYSLTINCQTITIAPASIPAGQRGSFYSVTFTQSGGIGATPLTLSGALPSGMSFSNGTLSGTPSQSGAFWIAIQASDANGCMASSGYNLVINDAATTARRAGDFNADGRADLFWRIPTAGDNAMWLMNGTTKAVGALLESAGTQWVVAGIADFDGDGRADVLWRAPASGANALWFMNGTTKLSGVYLETAAPSWSVAGVADFNGDGRADILWRDNATGGNAMWLMNGATKSVGAYLETAAPAWSVAGVADFNADGRADILWRDRASGGNAMWLMNGTAKVGGFYLESAPPAWNAAAVADFNADGRADIFWRIDASGANSMWLMDGATKSVGAYLESAGPEWRLVSFGDFNADGRADVFWRADASGANAMWLMNGITKAVGAITEGAPSSWRVVP